ncbi:MAG: DUF4845 domain-containing protein [Gammaproteobacteria bacterium]|nr:DUF4845 domain-containing protein [Gammaproteobacteria bacterium]
MQTLKSQRGMTAIGWLIVLGLIGFFVLLALRMTPSYLEYFTISSALESLQNEPGMANKTPQDIRTMLSKRFDINDVGSITAKDVDIQNQGGSYLVGVDYEVRMPVLGNVDVVMSFNKEIEVARN